jgi:phospholipase/carboxylesterase
MEVTFMFNRVRSMSFSSGELESLMPDMDLEVLPTELRELYQNWSESSDSPSRYSGSVAESDWPVSIYVPERYEEGYAYPLVIWFHSDANDEDQLEQVMSSVSSQNYIGLALRGNTVHDAAGGYRWDGSSLLFGSVPVLDLLHVTTCRLRRAFHIHSERIFLAGSGHGADVALQTLVQKPDWFAGAILLDPACSSDCLKADRLTGLRSKPVLMSVSRSCSHDVMARSVESVRLLRSAGARVDVELTQLPVDPTSNEARMLDHWMMGCINREALV